jgi:hypothetical protein
MHETVKFPLRACSVVNFPFNSKKYNDKRGEKHEIPHRNARIGRRGAVMDEGPCLAHLLEVAGEPGWRRPTGIEKGG